MTAPNPSATPAPEPVQYAPWTKPMGLAPNPVGTGHQHEHDGRLAEQAAPPSEPRELSEDEAQTTYYQGNSIAHLKARNKVYGEAIDRVWHVLKKHGKHPGRTDDTVWACVDAALAAPAVAAPQAARVFIVATGEQYEGRETYTRHDSPPPLCDYETLYTLPPASQAPSVEPPDETEKCPACHGTGVIQTSDSGGLIDQMGCDLCGDDDA